MVDALPTDTYKRTRRLYLEYLRALRDHAKYNVYGGNSFMMIKEAQRDLAYTREKYAPFNCIH